MNGLGWNPGLERRQPSQQGSSARPRAPGGVESLQLPPPILACLHLITEARCGLAIGPYPRFRYDASGGGGIAELEEGGEGGGWQTIHFDPAQLSIPALSWRNTRVLGLPLPPGLRIAIEPEQLQGQWHPSSGEVQLEFRSRFYFSLAGVYQAPPLIVQTRLQTETVQGRRHHAQGKRIGADGEALLVGIATVPPTGDGWLDRFLGLPDEALALLQCRLTPVNSAF